MHWILGWTEMVISFLVLATKSSSQEINSCASLMLFKLTWTSPLTPHEHANSYVYLWLICVILAPWVWKDVCSQNMHRLPETHNF